MILIKPENAVNAVGMLLGKFAMYLCHMGSTSYFLVDGMVWMKSDDGLVFRSDNDLESDYILKLIKEYKGNETIPNEGGTPSPGEGS